MSLLGRKGEVLKVLSEPFVLNNQLKINIPNGKFWVTILRSPSQANLLTKSRVKNLRHFIVINYTKPHSLVGKIEFSQIMMPNLARL